MKRPTKPWKNPMAGGALLLIVLSSALGWSGRVAAQEAGPANGLDVQQLRPNVYLIAGAGGNIVAQIGPIGVVLVDSGTTEAAPRVLAAHVVALHAGVDDVAHWQRRQAA